MANAIYPKWKEAVMNGSPNSALSAGNLKVALVDTAATVGYAYSSAHEFFSQVTPTATAVASTATLGACTSTSGVLKPAATSTTFASVAPLASLGACDALIVYINTGTASTSRLVAYLDTGITGMPVTPDNSNIPITWNTNGIFAL